MRDWIGSPREWGEWGMRATAWFNELVAAVNTGVSGLAAALVRVAALETNRLGYAQSTLTSWASLTTISAVSATSVTGVALQAGKRYKVSYSTHFYSTVAGDTLQVRIVGPSSTPVYAGWYHVASGASAIDSGTNFFYFTPGSTGDYPFFLQYFRVAGTGNVTIYADTLLKTHMTVEPLQ